jgi:hypothetical protein
MNEQTEARATVADIIRANIREDRIRPRQFEKVTIQVFAKDDGKKAMVIKLPKDILFEVQLNYASVNKAVKQKFSSYHIIVFVRDFGLDGGNEAPTAPHEQYKTMLRNVCFPFLVTGTRTDVYTHDSEVVNVLLERKSQFKPIEMEMIGLVLERLYGKSFAVAVNQNGLN